MIFDVINILLPNPVTVQFHASKYLLISSQDARQTGNERQELQ